LSADLSERCLASAIPIWKFELRLQRSTWKRSRHERDEAIRLVVNCACVADLPDRRDAGDGCQDRFGSCAAAWIGDETRRFSIGPRRSGEEMSIAAVRELSARMMENWSPCA